MENFTVMGIDIAKNVMQLHGETADGKIVLKKRISREKFLEFMSNKKTCLIGMEACGGSHYWAKELIKQGFDVKLMSPQKVKKYAGHNKNDANDAEACAEAVSKKKMTFVPIKTDPQMQIQSIHRVRTYFVRQRTGLMNMIRGLLLELGIAIPKSRTALLKKLIVLSDTENNQLDTINKALFQGLYEDLKAMDKKVEEYTIQLKALAQEDESCRRIQTIEGIGPLTATALIAKIGNGSDFKKGRDLSAYLGLVPKQHSSGDTQMLLGISKHGDSYIRQLLIHGGRSVVQAAKRIDKITGLFCKQDAHSQWVRALADRVGTNKASVAVANKNARMVIALLKNKTEFEAKLAH